MRIFIVLMLTMLQVSLSYAEDRVLASKGEHVELTIDTAYKCNSLAEIKIATSSADYFDQGAGNYSKACC